MLLLKAYIPYLHLWENNFYALMPIMMVLMCQKNFGCLIPCAKSCLVILVVEHEVGSVILH
jgi:hypothetical protein